jgi:hypothetical protein
MRDGCGDATGNGDAAMLAGAGEWPAKLDTEPTTEAAADPACDDGCENCAYILYDASCRGESASDMSRVVCERVWPYWFGF